MSEKPFSVTQYVSSKPIEIIESAFAFIYRNVDLTRFKITVTEMGRDARARVYFEIWSKEEYERLVYHTVLPKFPTEGESTRIVIPVDFCVVKNNDTQI